MDGVKAETLKLKRRGGTELVAGGGGDAGVGVNIGSGSMASPSRSKVRTMKSNGTTLKNGSKAPDHPQYLAIDQSGRDRSSGYS
jgi:hypothetical protein